MQTESLLPLATPTVSCAVTASASPPPVTVTVLVTVLSAASRHGDAGNRHGRSGHHSRHILQYTVLEIPQTALYISQRIQSCAAEGVAAQIIRQRQAGEGHRAAVGKTDNIGDSAAQLVAFIHRCFYNRQHLPQLAGDDVGIHCAAGIREGRHILKGCCHKHTSLKSRRSRTRALHPMLSVSPMRLTVQYFHGMKQKYPRRLRTPGVSSPFINRF